MTDVQTLLGPLRTGGLSDIVVAGRIDGDGAAPVFRPAGTDVYLTAEGEARMLRLEQVGDEIRLSLVTDYVVPPGYGDDAEFGVSSLRSLLIEWHNEPPLTRVRLARGTGSPPAVVRWIEFEFRGLRLTAGPVSSHGIPFAIGPGYDDWDDVTELPTLSDMIGVDLRDVVVPGYVERDHKVPELRVFPTIVYLELDHGLVEAAQVRGGGGVQFRPVAGLTAPTQLIDDDDEIAYMSLAPLLLDDSPVTGVRCATGPDTDLEQGIVRAAEFQLGDALRLVLDPMTLLGLELGVRRPDPPGESVTIELTETHRP